MFFLSATPAEFVEIEKWHSSTPNARSLSHSPSAPPPSFPQSPYPTRSLVRDERTHPRTKHYPHSPRLVVHSPPPPPANSFVIGPAVINTHAQYEKSLTTALHAQTSYLHGVSCYDSRSHAMCTGRDLIAGVARARLTSAENPVSGAGPACTRGRACSGREYSLRPTCDSYRHRTH